MKFGKGLLTGLGGAMLGLGYEAFKSHQAKNTTKQAVRVVIDGEVKDMVQKAFREEYQHMAREELQKVLLDMLKTD